ncbi:MAG: CaiB/BaiF CoA transferase family protein [Bradymonadia bacterium]|jgi:CoA:oxalate CoA-transferase
MSKVLEGVRVIDFTRVLAGPFCSMILADLGAEVIKIERPETGDDTRAYGPFINGESLYFMSVNRGKKSITLNLKNPKSVALLKSLIKTADVVVENFKPGVMKRLGLDYEALSAINPRLIYAASSGFGQTGPWSQKPAYDLIVQGLSGIMSLTGTPGGKPNKVGMSIADMDAGIFAALGIMAALLQREKTGRGQLVDIAMLDCMLSILENAATRYMATGVVPEAIGNRHAIITPFTMVEAKDGYLNIAAGNDVLFGKFAQCIGMAFLATDERFNTNDKRLQNWDALSALINEATRQKNVQLWLELLEKEGIPSGPINTMDKVVENPQVLARNMVMEMQHPVAGKVRCVGSPLKLSDSPIHSIQPSPTLGESNIDIICEITGCDVEEARRLVQEGEFH